MDRRRRKKGIYWDTVDSFWYFWEQKGKIHFIVSEKALVILNH